MRDVNDETQNNMDEPAIRSSKPQPAAISLSPSRKARSASNPVSSLLFCLSLGLLFCCLLLCCTPGLRAQASALPSAQSTPDTQGADAGRKLLDKMIAALGGPAWLNRTDYEAIGRTATFYKGAPNPYVTEFERYVRFQPFGERIIIVSKQGVFIPTTKRDVAEIWTPTTGYEVTYKGKKELPQKDIDEFKRGRAHSLETVVKDWLHQPGVLITYEGSDIAGRRLVEKVSILTAANDGVELALDESTHLPASLTYRWRDPLYKDFNTEVQEYDDYHPIAGVMTPLTLTHLHNGDIATQIFLREVRYNQHFPVDLFDPDRPLKKSAKK